MKTLILAAGAALALAGAAAAQQAPQPMPNMSTTAGRDSTGSPPMTTSAGTAVQSGSASDNVTRTTAGPNTPAGASATDASIPGSTMAGATMTANMPAGEAPSSYPKCTKRGQDRCTSTGRRGY